MYGGEGHLKMEAEVGMIHIRIVRSCEKDMGQIFSQSIQKEPTLLTF